MVVVLDSKIFTMTKSVYIPSFISVFVLIAILSCSPKLITPAPPEKRVEITGNMEGSILGYVNEHRRSIGLSSLETNAEANRQAYQHSKNMAERKTGFGHEGFDQRMQVIKQKVGWITASAENVAYGQLSAKEVVKGWLNSPGHKKNMEGNYRFTGVGVYKDRKGIIFFTQIFYRL